MESEVIYCTMVATALFFGIRYLQGKMNEKQKYQDHLKKGYYLEDGRWKRN